MFLSVTSFSNGRRSKCFDIAEFTKLFSISLGKQIEAKCLTICTDKVTKSFLKKNKHMQGWNPQKPTKLDGNETITSTHHPYILCHFASQYLSLYTTNKHKAFLCKWRRLQDKISRMESLGSRLFC